MIEAETSWLDLAAQGAKKLSTINQVLLEGRLSVHILLWNRRVAVQLAKLIWILLTSLVGEANACSSAIPSMLKRRDGVEGAITGFEYRGQIGPLAKRWIPPVFHQIHSWSVHKWFERAWPNARGCRKREVPRHRTPDGAPLSNTVAPDVSGYI